jgi:hypothetical protein
VSFADLFADDVEPPRPPEPPAVHERPVWLGPPEGELGVAVPLGLVLARSDRGVIALSHALAYSTGITFDLVAHVGGLEPRQRSSIFHDQHAADADPTDLPDGFLRFGVELADGTRVSNLGGWRGFAGPGDGPAGPVLAQHGGGGGQSSGSSISWSLGFWLWPLPPPGPIRLHCEWPVAGLGLAGADLDASPLLEAAARATRIWDDGQTGAAWTRSVSQHVMSATHEVAAKADHETLTVPAGELRTVQDALQSALRLLRRLDR